MSRFIFNDVKIPLLIIKYWKRIFIEILEDFLWLLRLLLIFLFIHLLFEILLCRNACFLAVSSPSLLTEAVYTMKNIATRGHWRYQTAVGSILIPVWILWHSGGLLSPGTWHLPMDRFPQHPIRAQLRALLYSPWARVPHMQRWGLALRWEVCPPCAPSLGSVLVLHRVATSYSTECWYEESFILLSK